MAEQHKSTHKPQRKQKQGLALKKGRPSPPDDTPLPTPNTPSQNEARTEEASTVTDFQTVPLVLTPLTLGVGSRTKVALYDAQKLTTSLPKVIASAKRPTSGDTPDPPRFFLGHCAQVVAVCADSSSSFERSGETSGDVEMVIGGCSSSTTGGLSSEFERFVSADVSGVILRWKTASLEILGRFSVPGTLLSMHLVQKPATIHGVVDPSPYAVCLTSTPTSSTDRAEIHNIAVLRLFGSQQQKPTDSSNEADMSVRRIKIDLKKLWMRDCWSCKARHPCTQTICSKCGRELNPQQLSWSFHASQYYTAVSQGPFINVYPTFPSDTLTQAHLRPCFNVAIEGPVRSVAVHPFEPVLAFGDHHNTIHIRPLQSAETPLSGSTAGASTSVPGGSAFGAQRSKMSNVFHKPQTLRWHSKPVGSLLWTEDGTVLLSGGFEGTLVSWNTASWKPIKLPRLGAIHSIRFCADLGHYVVACEPGTLHLIDGLARNVVATYHGIPFTESENLPTTIVACPASGSLVALCGIENSIVFFDPVKQRSVGSMAVEPFNPVSMAHVTPIPRSVVTLLAFSADAQWLLTITQSEQKLKGGFLHAVRFWHRTTTPLGANVDSRVEAQKPLRVRDRYELNTVSYSAHSGNVSAIAIHPMGIAAVSAGDDGELKLWKRIRASPQYWTCIRSVMVTGLCEPRAMSYSTDPFASVLLVAHDSKISLWDAQSLTRLTSVRMAEEASPTSEGGGLVSSPDLLQHIDRTPILAVHMLADQRTVVGYTASHLFVWDMLHGALNWVAQLTVTQCLPLPNRADSFGILASNRYLEFSRARSIPYYVSAHPVASSRIISTQIIPVMFGRFCLSLLSDDGQILTFTPEEGSTSALVQQPLRETTALTPSTPTPTTAVSVLDRAALNSVTTTTSPLQSSMSALLSSTSASGGAVTALPAREIQPCNFLFVGDTHAIPSLASMFDRFINNFLEKQV